MNEKALQVKIQSKVKSRLAPLFARYNVDQTDLQAVMKWKPMVLILGNYSSGKSTFINELIGRNIQRTGQAPTDDCFTVLTSPLGGASEGDLPGSDLVNDERLPFTVFKPFGEQFISHFRMRQIDSPVFDNLAIIDSPGMLDSVSEKDRGYDYTAVIKEFAKLADLIVLMFDPHKAGTIQETYNAIRNTLPQATGEDRILFVMSRIDECDNLGDLVRSYGTLCWNLSQMTGRKDIPRIFLTFSPTVKEPTAELEVWVEEREDLKKKVLNAPSSRISHILQDVDKQVQEVHLIAEAMRNFTEGGKKLFHSSLKSGLVIGSFLFLFLDVIMQELLGFPDKTLISSLSTGYISLAQLIIPIAGLGSVLLLFMLFFLKWTLPRYYSRSKANIDNLVKVDTVYRKNLWSKVKKNLISMLEKPRFTELYAGHGANLVKIERFMHNYLQKYYEMVRQRVQ